MDSVEETRSFFDPCLSDSFVRLWQSEDVSELFRLLFDIDVSRFGFTLSNFPELKTEAEGSLILCGSSVFLGFEGKACEISSELKLLSNESDTGDFDEAEDENLDVPGKNFDLRCVEDFEELDLDDLEATDEDLGGATVEEDTGRHLGELDSTEYDTTADLDNLDETERGTGCGLSGEFTGSTGKVFLRREPTESDFLSETIPLSFLFNELDRSVSAQISFEVSFL